MAEENTKPIDLGKIFSKLWKHKLAYCITLPIVLIVTYLLVCLVPRYYTSGIALAPESSGPNASGSSLSSLASSFGLGSLSKIGGSDAINAEMYPDLFKSNDFILKLMKVHVKKQDGSFEGTYYEYLENAQKAAPWDVWMYKIKQNFDDNLNDTTKTKPTELDIFNLTFKQDGIFEGVKGNIKCAVDKKTDVITIDVKDQDPLVAATIANECSSKLQEFMLEYRTSKARIDYNYYKKLCDEARIEYDKERKKYAAMADADMDVILQSVSKEQEEQENVMQLAYNKYTTLYTQMQMSQAKLQEATPVITVIKSASVPVKPAGPKRVLIALGMTLLVTIIMSLYFGIKTDSVKEIIEETETNQNEENSED